MQAFLNESASGILQLVVFSFIPFIWWLFTARKKENLFRWLGIKKPSGTSALKLLLLITASAAAYLLVSALSLYLVRDVETAVSVFEGQGVKALPAVLVYSVIRTGLSEEILFRGFILKRIASRFGYAAGNIIQSALFGLLHGAMFFRAAGAAAAAVITLITGLMAFCMGWINEKKAGGSIIPSWCIHAAVNFVTGTLAAL